MLTYFLFVLGFIFLIKGADYLVDGASAIAARLSIPHIVIGLTIVSFGTSAPELIVNLMASLNGNSDLSLGNIMGSNISNILLILGISGTIYPMTLKRATVWREIPFALLAVVVLLFTANDAFFDGHPFNIVSRIDGAVFILFFIIFMYYTFGISKIANDTEKVEDHSIPMSLGMIIIGALGLALGGDWIVKGATQIGLAFGLTEKLIGLTIIAIGTSLPELATSAVAAYKKNADIAVGNIVGSNIFNIFFVLGITSFVSPLNYNVNLNFDISIVIFATIILFFSAFVGKKHALDRWQCMMFLVFYIVYMSYVVIRG